MLPQASHMVIIVNFIGHFAGGPYRKLMENMVSFMINIFKVIETAIRYDVFMTSSFIFGDIELENQNLEEIFYSAEI